MLCYPAQTQMARPLRVPAQLRPPPAAVDFSCAPPGVGKGSVQECMEQVELVAQGKVALQFLRVERGAVLAHQRPYVIEVAGARGVVHVALQLEADQALDADHAKAAHRGVALRGPFQQLARQRAVRVQQVQPFGAAYIVGCVLAAASIGWGLTKAIAIAPAFALVVCASVAGVHFFLAGLEGTLPLLALGVLLCLEQIGACPV